MLKIVWIFVIMSIAIRVKERKKNLSNISYMIGESVH